MIKSIFLLILCLVFANFISFADDNVVAVVNNEAITQNDLDNFVNFMRMQFSVQYPIQEVEQRINQMLPDLINQLIEDRLILQAAYKENIIIDRSRIEVKVEQIKEKYPSKADFQSSLVTQGLSLADLEMKIKEQFLMFEIINKNVRNNVVVNPQEVTAYYEAHSREFDKPELRQVRFLTIKDPGVIAKLEKSIAEYKSLEAISGVYSLEITNLGWVTAKQLKKEIVEVVFSLKRGEISPLLNSGDDSYIIFEVKAIKPAQKRPLYEIQDEIHNILFEKRMTEALAEWIEQLKSEAYVEVKKVANRE